MQIIHISYVIQETGHMKLSQSFLIMLYNILSVTLIARKLSKPDGGRYRPKHAVLYC